MPIDIKYDPSVLFNSIEVNKMDDNLSGDEETSAKRLRRSRAALFKDDVRLSIIQEVFKKGCLWDSTVTEPFTPSDRKKAFSDIAAKLQTKEHNLKTVDVERQWKNLKDTYIKVKRKASVPDNEGNLNEPRWKFYSHLTFLDKNDLSQTINSSGMCVERALVSFSEPVVPTPPPHQAKIEFIPETPHYSISQTDNNISHIVNQQQPSTSQKVELDTADEYSTFCTSLIQPLREVGMKDKIEFYRFQKTIRDALFDIQMKLHSR